VLDGLANVIPISKPYKLASRELKKDDTVVQVGKVKIGGTTHRGDRGTSAVEGRDQIMEVARQVREAER
jgi:3-deoxy-D-arabino-heptulosonate 7-phosphate (DAHP) synthase